MKNHSQPHTSQEKLKILFFKNLKQYNYCSDLNIILKILSRTNS